MSKYTHFTKLKHLIFLNGGSIFDWDGIWENKNKGNRPAHLAGRIFGKSENEKKERRGSFIEKPLDYFKRSWQFPRT
jgi:hypothetical protein